MSKTFTNDATYDSCYKVNFLDDVAEGSIVHAIGGTPVANTYSIGEDTAGTYSATVYITAVSK